MNKILYKLKISRKLPLLWLFLLYQPICSQVPEQVRVSTTKKIETIKTELFKIKTTQYDLDCKLRGGGGALSIVGSDLIITSADGKFLKFDPSAYNLTINYLPALDLGEILYESSKFVTYKETPPRAHDLIVVDGFYYATHDFYDNKTDRVYFLISRCATEGRKWEVIYRSPAHDTSYFTLGSGGKMAVDKNRLYFTVGDFSLDRINGLPSDLAPQNLALPWGKVNYIDLRDLSFHVYTMGHRNSQGILLLQDGNIMISEHGPRGGDELNLLKMGANYGWPYQSYGTVYNGFNQYSENLPVQKQTEFTEPLFAFVPSVAPTQLICIKNQTKWYGDILLATLKDMSLYRVKYSGQRIIFTERIEIGQRIRDLKEISNSIWLLTDSLSLIEITVSPEAF